MAKGKIEERIEVTGGEQAKQELDKVFGATQRVGKEAEDTSRGTGRLGAAVGSLLGQIKSLAAGFIGVGGIIALLQKWRQELQETVRAVRETAQGAAELIAVTQCVEDIPLARRLQRKAATTEEGDVYAARPVIVTNNTNYLGPNFFGPDPAMLPSEHGILVDTE